MAGRQSMRIDQSILDPIAIAPSRLMRIDPLWQGLSAKATVEFIAAFLEHVDRCR
jgi:hypothetical protein